MQLIPMSELNQMAQAMGKNKLFGKTADDLLALMLLSQAEGKHPAIACQEYDIIQGKPALNSKSALARFQQAGGSVQWGDRTELKCSCTFSHPQGGSLLVEWTIDRATKAGLTNKDNWKKYPIQMLSARVIAEGVRAVFPGCMGGLYTSEEVQDFEPAKTERVVNNDVVQVKLESVEIKPGSETVKSYKDDLEYMIKRKDTIEQISNFIKGSENQEPWTEAEKERLLVKDIIKEADEKIDIKILDELIRKCRLYQVQRLGLKKVD